MGELRTNHKQPFNQCTGYDPPRDVHPAVCRWHSRERDPKCKGCPYFLYEIWNGDDRADAKHDS